MLNRQGWIFTDAMFLAAEVSLTPSLAARCLPGGISLAPSHTATLFVAHYPKTSFGSVYNEAGLFIDVRRFGRRASFCPWMLVDDDVALILGREALGYPKKLGTILLQREGDSIRATVERRGAQLFSFDGAIGGPAQDAPAMLGRRFYNAYGLLGLSLPRLLSFSPREEILEVSEVSLQMKIAGAARDPLLDVGLGEIQRAYLYRVNIGASGLPIPVRWVSPFFTIKNHVLRYL